MSDHPTFLEFFGVMAAAGGALTLIIYVSVRLSMAKDAWDESFGLRRRVEDLERTEKRFIDTEWSMVGVKARLEALEQKEKKHVKRNKAVK